MTKQCTRCKRWMRPGEKHDFFDVRKDYYRLSDGDHERLWCVYHICRQCAEKEWAKHDNPSGAQQESLFA